MEHAGQTGLDCTRIAPRDPPSRTWYFTDERVSTSAHTAHSQLSSHKLPHPTEKHDTTSASNIHTFPPLRGLSLTPGTHETASSTP